MARHRIGRANLTVSYLGRGSPKHKFEIARQQSIISVLSISLSFSCTKFTSPPALIMLSRNYAQLIEMLIMALIAGSVMHILFDWSRSTKIEIPPLSMIGSHC
jgi:hypothetical protein